jgi:hypothetical protein
MHQPRNNQMNPERSGQGNDYERGSNKKWHAYNIKTISMRISIEGIQ